MNTAGLKTFEQLYQAPNFNLQPAQNTVAVNPPAAAIDNKGLENGDTITIAGKEINKKKAIAGIAGFGILAAFIIFNASKGKKNVDKNAAKASIETVNEIRLNATGDFAARIENAMRNIEETKDRALDMLKRAEKYLKRYIDADLSDIAPDRHGRKILTKTEKKHAVTALYEPLENGKYILTQIQTSKLNNAKQNKLYTINIQNGKVASCKIQNVDNAANIKGAKYKELQIKENGYIYNENGTTLEVNNNLIKKYFKNDKSSKSEFFFLTGNGAKAKITKSKMGPIVEFDSNEKIISFADGIKKIRLDILEADEFATIGEEHIHAKYFLKANEAGELVLANKDELSEFI